MKWSWRVGRIAGIDLRIHATFLLLLTYVALRDYQQGGTPAAVGGLLFIVALFASVVLHELGHALTARRFGVATRDITLLPIGGVAQLERMPEEPKQELLIALAGPAVTVALVGVLYALLRLSGQPVLPSDVLTRGGASLLAQLMWTNVILAGFNLLPAFPMDGGRVLRAALAMRTDYVNATRIAATIGKAFALLFGLGGLFWWDNPFLVFIALFVWLGAASESTSAQFRSVLADVPVAHAMIRDVRTLTPRDTLADAARHVLAGFQQDFPVVEDGSVVGVLTRANLLKAIAEKGQQTPVADVMERSFQTAEPFEPLDRAFARLRDCRCHTLPVVSRGQLVGVLTTENVGEFVMIDAAVRGKTH